jgi:Tol biopolymer transport system component/DNA-binding winged helix-turn-helix (wHTH) protein
MPTDFRLGPWLIQPSVNVVTNHCTTVRVEPKVLSVLVYLAEHSGKVVSKEELMQAVWPDACVTDDTLTRCIYELRKVLQDDVKEPKFIQTIPRRGYRLIAAIDCEEPLIAAPNTSIINDLPAEQPPMPGPSGTHHETDKASKRIISGRLLYAIAVLSVILVCVSLLRQWIRSRHSGRQHALARVTFDPGLQNGATWSPDGRFIAYSSNRGGKFDVWVQAADGGNAVQITHEPGQNWQAEWSPDGKYIAYRSEYETGGLYIVPALGGARRKIADFGYYPRWSPDSSQIMFLPTTYGGFRSLYAVSLDGGPPHEIVAGFFAKHPTDTGRSAVWHPDGNKVSIYIWNYQTMAPSFWTIPLNGDAALKSEIDGQLLKQFGDTSSARFVADTSFSWAPSADAIYFERTFNGATNLWKMTVEPKTLRGLAMERLTTGPGNDTSLALTHDGKKLAFSSESRQILIWAAPFNPQSGKLTGNGQAVTSPGIEAWVPTLTPDGKKLAFSGNRGGNSQVWQSEMTSDEATPIVADDAYTRAYPIWSPDGTRLAYARYKKSGKESKIVVWNEASKEEQVIADEGDYDVYGWTPTGSELVVSRWSDKTSKAEVWLLSPSTGSCTERIAASPDYFLFQGQFSPDGRWVVFEAVRDVSNGRESSIYVVPAHGGDWIRVTDRKQWDDKPRWSPDGKTIYFVSGRGGFYNVWGNHFDPVNGRVIGAPFQLTNFDDPALMVPPYIPDVGLSIAQGRIAVTVSQSSGSIWMLNRVDE